MKSKNSFVAIRRYKLPAKRFLTAASWQEDKVATLATLQADKVARQGRRAGKILDCLQSYAIAELDTINCLQRHDGASTFLLLPTILKKITVSP